MYRIGRSDNEDKDTAFKYDNILKRDKNIQSFMTFFKIIIEKFVTITFKCTENEQGNFCFTTTYFRSL